MRVGRVCRSTSSDPEIVDVLYVHGDNKNRYSMGGCKIWLCFNLEHT
jgi:hypothetical protein